jgi:pilus assembly protein Flp/PilA
MKRMDFIKEFSMHSSFSFNSKRKGQGLVEYALILVLVGIVVVAALMLLGPVIGNVFSQINSSLAVVSGGGGGGAVPPPPPPSDCSAEQAAYTAAVEAFNACMEAHNNDLGDCQAEQEAVSNALSALEACTLP